MAIRKLLRHKGAFRWALTECRPYLWIVSLLSLLSVVASISGVGFALITRQLIDAAVAANGSSIAILKAAVPLGGIVLLQLSLQTLVTILSTSATERIQNGLRRRMFEKICIADWQCVGSLHSGDIMVRLGNDVSGLSALFINGIPSTVALFAQLIAAFLALFAFDRVMAAAAFLLGPLAIFSARLYSKRLKPLYQQYQKCDSAEKSFLQESVQNLLLIKTFRLVETFISRLSQLQKDKFHWVFKRNRMSAVTGVGVSLGYWLAMLSALLWGSYRLSSGAITFGTVTAFIQLVGQVQGPVFGLSRSFPQFVQTTASIERLMEIDSWPSEPLRDPGAITLVPQKSMGIVIKEVSYGYDPETAILQNVSLRIHPGELVGIMGPTGEGKTTLMRLLLSLVRPKSGTIQLILDDGSLLLNSPATRTYFSYVPQGNSVLTGTISENLKLGNAAATEAQLIHALQAACAWDFVSALPNGLSEMIGEKGARLSEGQAQRLAIARALLRDAPILLLDEATSALDADTEARVIQSIRQQGKTCVFVTHRMTVSMACDRVYRVENGTISPVLFNKSYH